MSDIIEGTAVVIHEDKPKVRGIGVVSSSTLGVKPWTQHFEFDAINKDAAWQTLVQYLFEHSGVHKIRLVTRSVLLGNKPRYFKRGTKYNWTFFDAGGDIAGFEVQVIEA